MELEFASDSYPLVNLRSVKHYHYTLIINLGFKASTLKRQDSKQVSDLKLIFYRQISQVYSLTVPPSSMYIPNKSQSDLSYSFFIANYNRYQRILNKLICKLVNKIHLEGGLSHFWFL